MTKNVKFIGIPEKKFLCIFIIALSPRMHTFFYSGEKRRSYYRKVKLHKMHFRGQGQSIKSEKYTVKMGISTFKMHILFLKSVDNCEIAHKTC